MSFSSDVKKELIAHEDKARHCDIAMFTAFINVCGSYEEGNLIISCENPDAVMKASQLVNKLTGLDIKPFKEGGSYRLVIDDASKVKDLSSMTGTGKELLYSEHIIDPVVVSSVCCKRAYIRGAFICSGSVTDPRKTYHMEFSSMDYEHCADLKKLIQYFGIDAGIVERKNHFVLYLKEGEQISDMLNIMSAHKALMDLENVRIVKDLRNNLNRIVNCETANINKVVSAAVSQIGAIEYIKESVGLDYLPEKLRETAELRLKYPDMSLKELGEMFPVPIGKSGVNHRLSKIITIAQKLKGDIKQW